MSIMSSGNEEGAFMSGLMDSVVVVGHNERKKSVPVFLLIADAGGKLGFESLVEAFSDSVGLWMVCAGEVMVDTKQCDEHSSEVSSELRSLIQDEDGWDSFFDEEHAEFACDSACTDSFKWECKSKFGKMV